MAVSTPPWLAQHGGALRPAPANGKWLVYFDDEPQYVLSPVPVRGQIACQVTQTINGKEVATSATAGTEEGACAQGLEELRKALGW